ncbi:transporter substrate-binding domain-containing protein [Maritalea porphyrae]|uniref:transporter substrate-binding domain-containing protein n=1 Tax=Maritalea porphyrae TaxID=880732 RepID=UPI0022AF075E|nr:transporter substrate-binding domain-containing protein [Maritalea porphyrae]MCZ4273199.1 transporter substrate-binding domain-containing protein [Maritalea porphyrae]
MNGLRIILAGLLLALVTVPSAQADTLDNVLESGIVRCGATDGHKGFSEVAEDGFWKGFDVDVCRAVSAAVFGVANRVDFTKYSGTNRVAPLQSGEVDIMARSAYWTMSRDTQFAVQNVTVTYFDGQALLVPETLGVVSAIQLNDIMVCAVRGSIEQDRAERYFFEHEIAYKESYYEEFEDLIVAYKAGLCNVVTAPASTLQAIIEKELNTSEHRILPERLSIDAWGPLVRNNDDRWQNVVRWTVFALINAEELGVSSRNIDTMIGSKNPKVRRLLGLDGKFGAPLGIPDTWAQDVIRGVGNYGEMFSRNFGRETDFAIARGKNELWTRGGLMYAPPVR